MKEAHEKNIDQIFAEGTLIDRALIQVVHEAVLEHKRDGNPIAVWRDGKTVWLRPEDIAQDK